MNLKEEISKLDKMLQEGREILSRQKESNKELDKKIKQLKSINSKAEKLIGDSPIL